MLVIYQSGMPIKYFSLFTGIGAAELAFRQVFPDAICVGYSEIDPAALSVLNKHFPKCKNYGDVAKIVGKNLPKFDVLIGGSPCTGFSSMNADKKEWDDPRSFLMLHYFRILEECRPKYFILENVASMTKQVKATISRVLGSEPVMINSANFTAQNRRRYYWTNFPVRPVSNDVNRIFLKDILVKRNDYKISNITIHGIPMNKLLPQGKVPYAMRHLQNHNYVARDDDKMGPVLTTYSTCTVIWDGSMFRQLSPIELERLQGFPDDWTSDLKIRDRVKCIGNAFTVPVIVYILQQLKEHLSKRRRAEAKYEVNVNLFVPNATTTTTTFKANNKPKATIQQK